MPTGHNLFAMYVQATKGEPTTARRKQWVLLPPLPDSIAVTRGMTVGRYSNTFLLFFREQRNPQNRSQWNHWDMPVDTYPAILKQALLQAESEVIPWTVSPIMTCEITETELAGIRMHPKTPWFVLDRVKRVAKSRHGLAI